MKLREYIFETVDKKKIVELSKLNANDIVQSLSSYMRAEIDKSAIIGELKKYAVMYSKQNKNKIVKIITDILREIK